jgi:uracil-DNA glycosylase
MLDALLELRQAFEHELALAGPFVPLGSRREPERIEEPVSSQDVEHVNTRVTAPLDLPVAIESTGPKMDLFGNKKPASEDPTKSPYERVEALIPDDSPIRDMKTLEEVRDYMANNVLVPIDQNRINPVFGVGPEDAGVMIIGEAPGADEDRHGEPFVGRAGQLLNKILEAINFKREDVYITNILKSRPPNNRDPEPEEVEAHMPALLKQIALIQPKIILCVGKSSGNALLGRRSSLGALRDKVHDFYGIPMVVTYHPAALLRNQQWKRPTWEDVKLLRSKYDQLVSNT